MRLGSSDHNQIHFNIKVKTGNTYKKQWRRNFNKGKYKVMRTYLANIDWNNLLKNKTATECWTCLKYEIEGIIEKFVPLRKQGKRSMKKHLSKEGIRKIANKEMLWRVHKHTGNVEDYTNYKEALNLAITEIRKYKKPLIFCKCIIPLAGRKLLQPVYTGRRIIQFFYHPHKFQIKQYGF